MRNFANVNWMLFWWTAIRIRRTIHIPAVRQFPFFSGWFSLFALWIFVWAPLMYVYTLYRRCYITWCAVLVPKRSYQKMLCLHFWDKNGFYMLETQCVPVRLVWCCSESTYFTLHKILTHPQLSSYSRCWTPTTDTYIYIYIQPSW